MAGMRSLNHPSPRIHLRPRSGPNPSPGASSVALAVVAVRLRGEEQVAARVSLAAEAMPSGDTDVLGDLGELSLLDLRSESTLRV